MRRLLMVAVMLAGCSSEIPTTTSVVPDVEASAPVVLVAAAFTPVPTPPPVPTAIPTDEPRRPRATATPEPTAEPEAEPEPEPSAAPPPAAPIVVNRADPTPTPWISCDNPDYVPAFSIVVVGDTDELSYILRALRAVLPDGREVVGGTFTPAVGREPIYYYRGDVDRTLTIRWTFRVDVAGGALTCNIERSIDVTIPARR